MKAGKDNAELGYLGLVPQLGVWIGGIMLFGIVAMIAANILTRWLFGVSIPGSHEISKYLFAISTSWAFGWALINRGNVRIDIVRSKFRPSLRAVFDIFNLLALGGFLALLGWRAIFVVEQSARSGTISVTPLATPMMIPQSLWAVGILLAVAIWLFLVGRVLVYVMQANWTGISDLAGPGSETKDVSAATEVKT